MKKIIIYTIILIVLLAGSVSAYFYQQYNHFLMQPVFARLPVTLNIEPGSSYSDFIKLIKAEGSQGAEHNWKIMARMNKLENSIKAGEYEILNPLTPRELITYIDENKVKTYSITIIEGHQWEQVKKVFLSSPLKHVLVDMKDSELKTKLGIKTGNLEGQFLPETYQYTKSDVDFDVLQRAHQELLNVLTNAWENRDPSIALKTPYELLILASIIERETAQNSERNMISGVFNRRLQKGMKLQTDPTVIYGVGSAYAGDITSAHLRTDTPYNTYTRSGLPPTPIAMASQASIEAAAHPNQGNELYFVANNKGGHNFSDTYEQHQKAVEAYLRGE